MNIETGKNKPFIVANVREILDGDFTFSRQVELFNQVAERFYASRTPDGKGYSRVGENEIEEAAINAGYPQSDKSQFTTTPWGQHNIFIEGAKWALSLPTPSTDEWVDVRERLPKENGNSSIPCLCWDYYHRQIRVLCYNEYHNVWDDEDGDDVYTEAVGGKVTHWQPLPAPPKH